MSSTLTTTSTGPTAADTTLTPGAAKDVVRGCTRLCQLAAPSRPGVLPVAGGSVCPTYGGEFCPSDQKLIDACNHC